MLSERNLAEVREDAARLAGALVDDVQPVHRGGNNEIYFVQCAEGTFALKYYRRDANDPRDRLATEKTALQFLKSAAIENVPAWFADDPTAGCALLEWIDGQPIDEVSERDIEASVNFVRQLSALSRSTQAAELPLASEACLSLSDAIQQIEGRADRLKQCGIDEDLTRFMTDEFTPNAADLVNRAESRAESFGGIGSKSAADEQTLSPSDLGFHNALRSRDRGLVFLDFEYFGRDDPVKLAADFLLHPGNHLSLKHQSKFAAECENIFADRPNFTQRLQVALPLFSLRWCMIMLNVFLEVGGDSEIHRVSQNRDPQSQLGKARKMLDLARKYDQEFANVA